MSDAAPPSPPNLPLLSELPWQGGKYYVAGDGRTVRRKGDHTVVAVIDPKTHPGIAEAYPVAQLFAAADGFVPACRIAIDAIVNDSPAAGAATVAHVLTVALTAAGYDPGTRIRFPGPTYTQDPADVPCAEQPRPQDHDPVSHPAAGPEPESRPASPQPVGRGRRPR